MKRQLPENCKGKKGKSGRKSATDEVVKSWVINKSWERIRDKFLKKKKTPEDEKHLDIVSLEVAKKTIPTEVKGDLNGKFTITWEA